METVVAIALGIITAWWIIPSAIVLLGFAAWGIESRSYAWPSFVGYIATIALILHFYPAVWVQWPWWGIAVTAVIACIIIGTVVAMLYTPFIVQSINERFQELRGARDQWDSDTLIQQLLRPTAFDKTRNELYPSVKMNERNYNSTPSVATVEPEVQAKRDKLAAAYKQFTDVKKLFEHHDYSSDRISRRMTESNALKGVADNAEAIESALIENVNQTIPPRFDDIKGILVSGGVAWPATLVWIVFRKFIRTAIDILIESCSGIFTALINSSWKA